MAGIVDRVAQRYRRVPPASSRSCGKSRKPATGFPPAATDRLQAVLGVPRTKIEGVAGFYSFFTRGLPSPHPLSDNITDRMAGNLPLGGAGSAATFCKVSEDGLGQRRQNSGLGKHVRPGPASWSTTRAVTRPTPGALTRSPTWCATPFLGEWSAAYFAVADNVRRADILLGHTLQPGDVPRAAWTAPPAIPPNMRSWREGLLLIGARRPRRHPRRNQARQPAGPGGAVVSPTASNGKPLPQRAAQTRPAALCRATPTRANRHLQDRVLLTAHADLVFEGMTVAAYTIGARRGFLPGALIPLPARSFGCILKRRREQKLLGRTFSVSPEPTSTSKSTSAPAPTSAGEEWPLIESLEGKRGTPRNRPPSRDQRLPLTSPSGEQRRNLRRRRPHRGHAGLVAIGTRHWQAPRSFRFPAIASGPASTNIPSASLSARCFC